MGLGSATKKIQQIADMAEKLYERLNQVLAEMQEVRDAVRDTRDRVDQLEHSVDRQAVLLEALAEREGIDVDQLYAEAAIEEAEPVADAEGEAESEEETDAVVSEAESNTDG